MEISFIHTEEEAFLKFELLSTLLLVSNLLFWSREVIKAEIMGERLC